MASIRQREGTKFWFACVTLPNGRRVQRSTKETNRKKAQQIADKWEAATRGRMTARQTQKVIAELYRDITGQHLVFPTVREYFDSWVARKKPETAPASGVKVAKLGDASRRRGFTIPEIKRILEVANDEWRSLIFLGLYTGQRLGDLARLTWQNVDLERDEIRFVSRKTGRTMIIPIAPPLRAQIENLPAGDDPRQPLHPRAFASVKKSGGVNMLSRQFRELLADAGLATPKAHRTTENAPGRDGPRELSQISFHSLRHTATSLMKNAGINASVVMDIIGHESEAISAHYTHIDEETKRAALNALPNLNARQRRASRTTASVRPKAAP
jgi:integrase